jgi:hypothetical protein
VNPAQRNSLKAKLWLKVSFCTIEKSSLLTQPQQVNIMFRSQRTHFDHSRPPYLDGAIDRWKVLVLSLLFLALIWGAVTWVDGTPWA